MTFIQPHKNKTILDIILTLTILAIGAGVFGMVALYNATVNISHNLDAARVELDAVGATNITLNNTVIAALGSDAVAAAAASHGLVADQKPEYLTVHDTWSIASHF